MGVMGRHKTWPHRQYFIHKGNAKVLESSTPISFSTCHLCATLHWRLPSESVMKLLIYSEENIKKENIETQFM